MYAEADLRHLRTRLTAVKPLVCDKLVVSPVHAETLNSLVYAVGRHLDDSR